MKAFFNSSGGFGLAGMFFAGRLVALLTVVFLALPGESRAAITSLSYDPNGNQLSQQTATATAPVILGSTPNQVVASGEISGFSVTVTSPLAVTYQWYFNGVAIAGATGDSLLLTNITSANQGNYTVTVTNSSGSVTSGIYRLGFDGNGNGLPDSWEQSYFGNLNQTAGGDYDGDSISNLDEYFGGTDPTVREIYYWIAPSGDFNTAANWSRNRVPGVGDTAIINTGTFTLPADMILTVSQVTVNAPFTAPAGTNFILNITGNWIFNGSFTLTSGKQFAVSGRGTVTVAGTTNLNGASLLTENGAHLSFPNVTSYAVPAGLSVDWIAQRNDSVLSFPNLASIIGPTTPNSYLDLVVRYDNNPGPAILLPALTSIIKGNDGDIYHDSGVRFTADSSGTIAAPKLSTFHDNDPHPNSSLYAINNGVLALPALLAPKGVNINLNALSHPEQFTSLVGTRSFVVNSGTVVISNLDSIAGLSSILAENGAQVSFPNVTSYAVPAGLSVDWIAQRNGSVLSFPNLTTITGPTTPNTYLDLIVRYDNNPGPAILLPALTSITKGNDGDIYHDSGVRFTADSSGTIAAPKLSTFHDNDPHPNSSLYAINNGVLALPALLAPRGVNINLNALSHAEQFTSLVGTRSFTINGGTVVMSNLNSIVGFGSIVAENGAQLSFPNVTSYAVPPGLSVNWIAQRNGSVLNFPNLTTIAGPATPNTYLDLIVRYDNNPGALLSLPALISVTKSDDGDIYANSGVRFTADGSGTISAPNLNTFHDNDSRPNSSLTAYNNGTMILYSLALSGVRGVTLNGVTLPATVPAPKAINLSTRMLVHTGDNVGIGGFIITGSTTKRVIIRAIGPSLTAFGVPNALADPILELHGPSAFVTITNNNWRETQENEIQGTRIPPTNDLESAIVVTLVPGPYTAIVRGNGTALGVGLVEVYDLNQIVDAKLANVSSRAHVGTGDNIVIAGFVLSIGSGNDRVVVRGLGPSLTAFGVPDALGDPKVELRDTNGTLLSSNNDWHDDPAQAAALTAAGLAPSSKFESAIIATLPTGLYTALLSGTNGTTGVGVVEVYDLGGPQ